MPSGSVTPFDQVRKPEGEYDGNVAALFDEVYAFLGRFVAYPADDAHIAHTLWLAHCHLMDAWDSTPRIAFLSPEPGSGKTRALEVSELLTPNPVEAVNVTPAYLFRKIGDEEGGRPTILYDEIDTVFGPKAKDNEEIRGLLNAGHRRGAVAGRCVVKGKTVVTEEIPAYCAVAMAGLGNLPDTLLTRAVVIRMRRRAPNERVEPYRRRVHVNEGHELRDRLADWAGTVIGRVTNAWPELPPGIEDRDADVWEALLAIADLVGEGWPARARGAAVSLVTQSKETSPSLGVRLLADLREAFADDRALSTNDVLSRLCAMEEAPWGDLRGKQLDARGLSSRLRQYGVKRKQIRLGEWVGKGYEAADLADAWERYLPPSDKSVTSVTTVTSIGKAQKSADFSYRDVTDSASLLPIDRSHSAGSVTTEPQEAADVTGVTDVTDLPEGGPEHSGNGYDLERAERAVAEDDPDERAALQGC